MNISEYFGGAPPPPFIPRGLDDVVVGFCVGVGSRSWMSLLRSLGFQFSSEPRPVYTHTYGARDSGSATDCCASVKRKKFRKIENMNLIPVSIFNVSLTLLHY